MSTERAESDGRQQHKPGSDDITANKTRASTTKGPLPVYRDLPIVLTSSAYQAELFLAHSIRNVITYRSVARRREGKVQQGKKRKQRDKWKCSLVGKKKQWSCLIFGSLTFSPPRMPVPQCCCSCHCRLSWRPAYLTVTHMLVYTFTYKRCIFVNGTEVSVKTQWGD